MDEQILNTDVFGKDSFFDHENIHPNSAISTFPQKAACPKSSHVDRGMIQRGDHTFRPISPTFLVDSSATTFSSLSKAGNIARSWTFHKSAMPTPLTGGRMSPRNNQGAAFASLSTYSTPVANVPVDRLMYEIENSSSTLPNGATSPSLSVSSSSRKRGSCDSPPWVEQDQDGLITLCTTSAQDDTVPSSMVDNDVKSSLPVNHPFDVATSQLLYQTSPCSAQKLFLKKEAEGIFNFADDDIKDVSLGHQQYRFMTVCTRDSNDEDDDSSDSMVQSDDHELVHDVTGSELRMDTSLDESDDELISRSPTSHLINKRSVELVSRPPAQVKRISSTSSASFTDSVFAPVDIGTTKTTARSNSQSFHEKMRTNPLLVFDSMSSYDDLKYLVKELRRLKSGKTFTSFGAFKTWAIPLPHSWSSERRYSFVNWATRDLGFHLRNGGRSVIFLQTQSSTGLALLQTLEMALLEHKKLKSSEQKIRVHTKRIHHELAMSTTSIPFTSQLLDQPQVQR
jgi:hypothetical protein